MPAIFDLDAAKQTILEELPTRARWTVGGEPLRYDFSRARDGLIPVADAIEERWLRETWRPLAIFGSSDYSNGGGATSWLTIDRRNGSVLGVDLERDDEPVYLINSSLPRFIATFRYLDAFLSGDQSLPADGEGVVRGIDDAAYPTSEWRALLEYLATPRSEVTR